MKELTKQQEEFLNKIKATKTYLDKSTMTSGNKYYITLQYNKKRISFHFNDNIYNDSDKNDFLHCLLYDSEAYSYTYNFADFMNELGLENESDAKKIYNACKRQYARLHKLFNESEIEMLEEIYQDY